MMIRRLLILIAISLFAAAPFASAKPPAGKGKAEAKMAEKATEMAADAEALADEARGKAAKHDAADAKEKAKGKAEDLVNGKDKAKDKAKAKGKDKVKDKDDDELSAGDRADEMRARRDERKAIMEETKGSAADGEAPKGKKAWWKFWGDEEAAAAE